MTTRMGSHFQLLPFQLFLFWQILLLLVSEGIALCAKLWPVRKLLASLVMSCSFLAHAPDYCIKFPFMLPSWHWGFIKTQSVMFSRQGALQLTPSVSLPAWLPLHCVLTANIPRRAASAFPGVLRCAWYSSEIINLTLQGSGFWYGPAV